MAAMNDLKDSLATSTGKLVLLTLATAGLYPIIWVTLATRQIQSVTQKAVVGTAFPIAMTAAFGWAAILSSARDRDISEFASGLSLGVAVLYIVWAFKAKKVIEEYAVTQHRVDPKMNSFYTFFLNVFYICYCINDLPNEQRKQQTLSGQA